MPELSSLLPTIKYGAFKPNSGDTLAEMYARIIRTGQATNRYGAQPMKATIPGKGLSFTDNDVVNPDDFIPQDGYNPHRVHPWLLHDHGLTLAVVFADSLRDALDIAADAGKLDRFKIDPNDENDRADYLTSVSGLAYIMSDGNPPVCVGSDGQPYWWHYDPTFLGNASEPFDIESLGCLELNNPPFSFAALWTTIR